MLQGWKTLIFNVAVLALGAVQEADIATIVPPQYVPYAVPAIAVANLVLRWFATGPIGPKK